jgi:hypothetical protein
MFCAATPASDREGEADEINTDRCFPPTGQSWKAAWAFELIGTIFLLWMMIMSYQVYQDN